MLITKTYPIDKHKRFENFYKWYHKVTQNHINNEQFLKIQDRI